MLTLTNRIGALALCVLVVLAAPTVAVADVRAADPTGTTSTALVPEGDWIWPLAAFRLERAFVAPAHAYGPGHRGVDLRPVHDTALRAPAAGTVAFSGQVAGRGILTIDHGDGLVTTLEPVGSPLPPGARVERGAPVGTLAAGGHAAAGTLHFGVRLHGEYINPMVLLGGVPRAVLLPCC